MDEQIKQEMARKVFEALCRHLDDNGLNYDKKPEDLHVIIAFNGEDMPVNIVFQIDALRNLIRVFSPLPVQINEKKRVEGAVALSAINYSLVDGCFDYDLLDGKLAFRMAAHYCSDVVEDDLIQYLIGVTFNTVEEYNDKLLALDKGMLSAQDILKSMLAHE